ncbi:unnamed protein product [Alternaria alternata]
MKLFIVASLVLSIVAAAIVQPGQPLSPGTHIIAIEGYDGTFNSEMLLVSTEGESVQPSSAFGTDNDPIAILGTPTTPKAAKVTQISRPHDPEPIIILPLPLPDYRKLHVGQLHHCPRCLRQPRFCLGVLFILWRH